jgi:hypothetical protein
MVVAGADDGIRVIGLGIAGRREEAMRMLTSMRRSSHLPAFQSWTANLMAWLERRPEDMQMEVTLGALKIREDPEAIFQQGWLLCDAGDHERGLGFLRRAVSKGYFVVATLKSLPQFEALRAIPEFHAVIAHAEAGRREALTAFHAAGGDRLLGELAGKP